MWCSSWRLGRNYMITWFTLVRHCQRNQPLTEKNYTVLTSTLALATFLTLTHLPAKPGTICILREYNEASDLEELVAISNGSPMYGESAYSPSKLFYWIVNGLTIENETTFEWPSASKGRFQDYLSIKGMNTRSLFQSLTS